ncbi:MAG: hypothetical protein ACODAJ_02625 [Planctomycetota bacterium]
MTTRRALQVIACVAYALCSMGNGQQAILCVAHDDHMALGFAHGQCCGMCAPQDGASEPRCECCVDIPIPLPTNDPHIQATPSQAQHTGLAWADAAPPAAQIREPRPVAVAAAPIPSSPMATLRTTVLLL